MKKGLFFAFVFLVAQHLFSQTMPSLPVWNELHPATIKSDWLINTPKDKAGVYLSMDKKNIILYNGLVRRTFRISPNIVCFDFRNITTGQELIRAIEPEAIVTIDGKPYSVGGLHGQQEKAFFKPDWLDAFTKKSDDLFCTNVQVENIKSLLNWKKKTWGLLDKYGTGKKVSFTYHSSIQALSGVEVIVQYEIYDGIPLIVKSVLVKNNSDHSIIVNKIINESLGLVEEESAVVGTPEQMKKQHGIYVETNYAFNNAMRYDISDQTTHWNIDSTYTSQVNYNYQTPCLLQIYPEKVTSIVLSPSQSIQSVRTHELLMDSYDRERRGLMIQKMYATVAPWTTQNPIFMHLVSANDDEVKTAVDQCAATGYEALILSFGSHCDMEDTSELNVKKWKYLTDYAHSKGIQIGSYSLFSSRRIDDETDVISPLTGKPGGAFFGNAPCMGSKWGLTYIDKLKYFISSTGFDIFENDGPYPGDVCASTVHPGHSGLEDSQWKQMQLQKELYHWCNEHGIYVNAPDWYFLDGTHKIGVGYREVNFSLSREQQKIINRQNIHDGTFEKSPSMGWGFVPLTRYQGGGPEAVLEPLQDHLKDYEMLMVQYYGAGVQACYRGPRLYDTEKTKQLVVKTISWYKQYRNILNSPIIHLRRADGREWDGFMHVNPSLDDKAFVMLFNPTKTIIKQIIKLPLYYAGLTHSISLTDKYNRRLNVTVDNNHEASIEVEIKPDDYSWYVVKQL